MDCKDPAHYSEEISVEHPIHLDIAGLAGHNVKICMVGKNPIGVWQSFDTYTSISSLFVQSPTVELLDLPQIVGEETYAVHIQKKDQLGSFSSKIGTFWETDCMQPVGYVVGNLLPSFEYQIHLHDFETELLKICFRSTDLKGNEQPLSETHFHAFLYVKGTPFYELIGLPNSWKDEEILGEWKRSKKPDTITVSQHNSLSLLPMFWVDTNHVKYRYKFAGQSADCSTEAGYSEAAIAGAPIHPAPLPPSDVERNIYFCLLSAMDGKWQSLSTPSIEHWVVKP